ncbi:serine/threonine protein kinase [Candidatus Uabimicrobium amorphum]|uniref:non-specific serine/threonine protein kinase n=1 Tax=Uabimicrobium amorphum TaxID=2596890 RepID=A0A5S9IQ25_UABAM|nr:protein kinase [Candidatus Uabimicrobium amorphum]BBM85814.1 protein kinase [Candidatus Uabimicrobium amorphum]
MDDNNNTDRSAQETINAQETLDAQENIAAQETLDAQETLEKMHQSVTKEKIPKKIGRYEIISELGRGGMGVVFKAKDTKLNRIVALKVLIGNILTQERKTRFFAEAQSMAKLNHENIIKLYDYGDDNGVCFFTMDYIEGQTLDKLLKQQPISLKKTALIIEKICRAMSYCHSQKIIHRDLKPSNIMMKDGKPFVMDFGIAKQEAGDEEGLTKSGAIIGSPHYMSPEQAEGDRKNIDSRTDVYSLGMILYHCITGKPCFADESVMKILMKIMRDPPVPPRQIKPRIPESLEKICLKALEKTKEDRYASMELFANDIRKFIRGEDVNIRLSKPSSPAKKWSLIAAAVVVVAICALAFGGNSRIQELRTASTNYLEQGFSQKAVDTAQQILYDEIDDEDAWQIWFSANYQLLSKNSYTGVEDNFKKMTDNIPLQFEVETIALKSALQAQKLIQERSLRKAQEQWLTLQAQNRILLDPSLKKTIENLQGEIKATKLAIEKEKTQRAEQEKLAEKKKQEQLELERQAKLKQQELQKQLEEQERKAAKLKEELDRKEQLLAAEKKRAQEQKDAKERERLLREKQRKIAEERERQLREREDDFLKRRGERRNGRNGRNGRPPHEPPLGEKWQEGPPHEKPAKTQMFRCNIRRDGHTFAPDVTTPIVKKEKLYGKFAFATAPVIVGRSLYIHNQVTMFKIGLDDLEIKQTFLKPKQNFTTQTIKLAKARIKEERSALLWHNGVLYFACNAPVKRRKKIPSFFCAVKTRPDKDILIDSLKMPTQITTSPLVYKNNIYFGCRDGYIYVLALRNGKLEVVTKYGRGKRAVISSPIILNNRLIVKHDSPHVFSYSLKKRNDVLFKKIGNANLTTPVAYDNLLFFTNASGYVGCLDQKLEEQWLFNEEPATPITSLGISADHAYIFYRKGIIQVLDRFENRPIGFGDIGPTRSSPIFTRNYMYIGNDAQNRQGSQLHIFDLNHLFDEGEYENEHEEFEEEYIDESHEYEIKIHSKSRPLKGDIVAEPLLHNGRIYVVTTAGYLYVMANR